MCQPGLRHDLAKPSTNLRADLGFHQLAGDDRDRLPHEILKPPVADLRDDIGNRRHALTIGHRGVSIHVDCGNSRRVRRRDGRPSRASTYQALVTPLLPTRPVIGIWRAGVAIRAPPRTRTGAGGARRLRKPGRRRPNPGATAPVARREIAAEHGKGKCGPAYRCRLLRLRARRQVQGRPIAPFLEHATSYRGIGPRDPC